MVLRLLALIVALSACRMAFAADARPNVLFIVSDDLTACLGCYGNEVCRTPNLDRLAARGVVFDRAYCQFPLCGPSRASFMSGLYPNTTRMLTNTRDIGSYRNTNPDLAGHPSIGGFLRRNGYASVRVSKIYHMGIPAEIKTGEPGGDDPDSWDTAFNIQAPEVASPGKLELLSPLRLQWGSNFSRVIVPNEYEGTQPDVLAADRAVKLLENRARGGDEAKPLPPDKPFFLAVGFVRPHVPLIAPRRIFDLYPEDEAKLPHVPEGDLDDVPEPAAAMENMRRYGMNELQQKQALAAYYATVTFLDEQVGRLLDALDRLDLSKNTIVIFTSDHGYNLGEHHCWQKLSLFEESARVPLIIAAPGFGNSAGKHSKALVELVDLYPTIAELVGLADKAPKNLQGTSMCKLLENPAENVKQVAYTVTNQRGESIRTDRWRYNRWGAAGEELYDHESDPHEFTNLASDLKHTNLLEEMRRLLAHTRKRSRK